MKNKGLPSLFTGWFLFSLNLDLELRVDGYVPVLLSKSQTRVELTLAVTSVYFCGDQKEGNCPFVLKHSYQGEISARINDLGRKKVELCVFSCTVILKCINCFYRAFLQKLGVFMGMKKLQNLFSLFTP